jgi:hypothetical protein
MSKILATGFSSLFQVFTILLILSPQFFDKVQGNSKNDAFIICLGLSLLHFFLVTNVNIGGGSQYCLSSDGFHSPECGPSGIESPPEVLEENSIKDAGSSWWIAPNLNLEVYVKNISNNILIIPKTFSLIFIYSFNTMVSIGFCLYDAFNNYAVLPASYLQNALLKQLSTLILPSLYGLLMVVFSWLLVYYDSKIPGVFPPTPVSPKKHR